MSEELPEVRCPYCNKLFFKGYIWVVEVKCPRCKNVVNLQVLNLKDRIKQAKKRR